jgi:hypothetical protein
MNLTNQPIWKRPIYLALTALLGVILSFGLHAAIEMIYLTLADKNHWIVKWSAVIGDGLCALPAWLQISLPILGAIGGFLVGRVWWRWVYIKGRWRK